MKGFGRLFLVASVAGSLAAAASAQTPPSVPGSSAGSLGQVFSGIGHKFDHQADLLADQIFQKEAAANAYTHARLTSVSGLPDKKVAVIGGGDSGSVGKVTGSSPVLTPPISTQEREMNSIFVAESNDVQPIDDFGMATRAGKGGGGKGGGGKGGGGKGGGNDGCDPVPEPGTMLALALGGSVFAARRKKKNKIS